MVCRIQKFKTSAKGLALTPCILAILLLLACKNEDEERTSSSFLVITAFGASIVEGSKEYNYEDLLQAKLAQTFTIPIYIYNRGISGQTTKDGLARIKRVLQETKPKYILITLGTNDALLATKFRTPLTETYKNMDAIISICKENKAKPILSSLTGVDTLKWDLSYRKNLMLVNTAYQEIAEKHSIPFLDLYTPLSGHSEFFIHDGIHLNEKGYQLMAEAWYQILPK